MGGAVDFEALCAGRLDKLHAEPIQPAHEAELAKHAVCRAAAGDGDLDEAAPVVGERA